MKFVGFVALIFFLAGCVSKSKLDSSLVAPWSERLSKEEPYEYPFKAVYQRDGKKLIYIASLHANTVGSPTFKMIEVTFKTQKIEFVLLEGFGSALGVSPKDRVEWASKQGAGGSFDGFETAFSVLQASAMQVPFAGGEPAESFVLSEVRRAGYTTEDLMFYQFMQQVFQFRESHPNSEIDTAKLFEKFITWKSGVFGLKPAPTLADFKAWYVSKMGQEFSPMKIAGEDLAPYEDGKLFTQRVSSVVCKIRDQYVLTRIDEALAHYNTVLVIYGGSHWSTQKLAFEKALGLPKFEK